MAAVQPAESSRALLTHVYGDDNGSAARLMQMLQRPTVPGAGAHVLSSIYAMPCTKHT